MHLTATQKYFHAPRAAAYDLLRGECRVWLDRIAAVSWVTDMRRRSGVLTDAADASLHAWRSLDTEPGQALLDRLGRVHGASVAIAQQAHDRCGPAVSSFYDRAIPALERAILGARALCDHAGRHRQVTLFALVLGLPALSFVLFALAHWVTGDAPAASGLAAARDGRADGGAYARYDGGLGISSTLVEPPAFGARLPAAALVAARFDDRPVIANAAVQAVKPDVMTILPARLAASDTHALTANVSFPAAGLRAPADPDAALYPFTPRPRPWRVFGADTPARMVPEPGPRAAAGATPETIYRVQLAAVGGREQAVDLWHSLNRTDADLLGSLQPDISSQATRRNESIYRLRAGPLNSRTDAETLCSALKSRKVDCLVVEAAG